MGYPCRIGHGPNRCCVWPRAAPWQPRMVTPAWALPGGVGSNAISTLCVHHLHPALLTDLGVTAQRLTMGAWIQSADPTDPSVLHNTLRT